MRTKSAMRKLAQQSGYQGSDAQRNALYNTCHINAVCDAANSNITKGKRNHHLVRAGSS